MGTLRVTRPGAVYHVTVRTNRKEEYLESPIAKDLFVETMKRLREKHDCQLFDFVVMNNHIHLVIRPLNDSPLSECMKWLLGVYSMNYNRVFKTWGSVWGGRYFSRPINGLVDLSYTIANIDHNPVRASLVDSPEAWPWGGLYFHRACRSDVIGPPPACMSLIAPAHQRLLLRV
jgi:REP element-mobilizing transposase RayT